MSLTIKQLEKMEAREIESQIAQRLDLPIRHYSTDPAADYQVLQHVREKWDMAARERYRDALNTVIRDRNIHNSQYDQKWQPNWAMAYEPGDYSKAALLALDVKEQNDE